MTIIWTGEPTDKSADKPARMPLEKGLHDLSARAKMVLASIRSGGTLTLRPDADYAAELIRKGIIRQTGKDNHGNGLYERTPEGTQAHIIMLLRDAEYSRMVIGMDDYQERVA
jgi:hypothetical protein